MKAKDILYKLKGYQPEEIVKIKIMYPKEDSVGTKTLGTTYKDFTVREAIEIFKKKKVNEHFNRDAIFWPSSVK